MKEFARSEWTNIDFIPSMDEVDISYKTEKVYDIGGSVCLISVDPYMAFPEDIDGEDVVGLVEQIISFDNVDSVSAFFGDGYEEENTELLSDSSCMYLKISSTEGESVLEIGNEPFQLTVESLLPEARQFVEKFLQRPLSENDFIFTHQ